MEHERSCMCGVIEVTGKGKKLKAFQVDKSVPISFIPSPSTTPIFHTGRLLPPHPFYEPQKISESRALLLQALYLTYFPLLSLLNGEFVSKRTFQNVLGVSVSVEL